jgi:hypothetical protein
MDLNANMIKGAPNVHSISHFAMINMHSVYNTYNIFHVQLIEIFHASS